MNRANNNYRFPILLAILLHAILLVALLIRFTSASDHLANPPPTSNIINATVVNQTSTSSPQSVVQPQPMKSKVEPSKKIITEGFSTAATTTKQLPAQKQQPVKTIVSPPLDLKKQQQEKLIEHKRLVAEQLKQALAVEQKQAKAKQELAAKNAAEQVAKELMQSELAATDEANKSEAKSVKTASSAQNNGEIDKYKTLIIQAISQQWIIPDDTKKNSEAKLLVTLAPGGMVLNVKIVQSSGDPVLDRSAETAVYKASPLPVPNDGELFNKFRTLNLIVRPEGILTGM